MIDWLIGICVLFVVLVWIFHDKLAEPHPWEHNPWDEKDFDRELESLKRGTPTDGSPGVEP